MKKVKFNIFHIDRESDIRIIDIVHGLLVTEETYRGIYKSKKIWKEIKP